MGYKIWNHDCPGISSTKGPHQTFSWKCVGPGRWGILQSGGSNPWFFPQDWSLALGSGAVLLSLAFFSPHVPLGHCTPKHLTGPKLSSEYGPEAVDSGACITWHCGDATLFHLVLPCVCVVCLEWQNCCFLHFCKMTPQPSFENLRGNIEVELVDR